jgi:hypothetical protein
MDCPPHEANRWVAALKTPRDQRIPLEDAQAYLLAGMGSGFTLPQSWPL